jgi:hypothetical protein
MITNTCRFDKPSDTNWCVEIRHVQTVLRALFTRHFILLQGLSTECQIYQASRSHQVGRRFSIRICSPCSHTGHLTFPLHSSHLQALRQCRSDTILVLMLSTSYPNDPTSRKILRNRITTRSKHRSIHACYARYAAKKRRRCTEVQQWDGIYRFAT